MQVSTSNVDTRPSHYGGESNPFEVIKIAEYYDLNFSKGNILKYLLRCGKKAGEDPISDLLKIQQYAQFEINRLQKESTPVDKHK